MSLNRTSKLQPSTIRRDRAVGAHCCEVDPKPRVRDLRPINEGMNDPDSLAKVRPSVADGEQLAQSSCYYCVQTTLP